jgi:hypothetical protein
VNPFAALKRALGIGADREPEPVHDPVYHQTVSRVQAIRSAVELDERRKRRAHEAMVAAELESYRREGEADARHD